MSQPRNALQPGHRVHWYVIREVLGQGGFGITYLADDANLVQRVAIKEYLPVDMAVREGDASVHPVSGGHGAQFRWGLDRFISEAQTLARFKHPNIVRVFTVFTANNTAYMVMEYEEGHSLDQLLKERRTLPEEDLRPLLSSLLDGLEQVHAAGFIHRDVKPANIFIRGDGGPVLLDFGSARQSLGERTRTLTAMVSPGFAPFEQYTGKGDKQGPWTDIYGLGATLYRAVTGRAPASAMDRSEAILQTSRDSYVPVAEIHPPGYSPPFLLAIDRALAFRPEDRPQSVEQWRSLLEPGRGTSRVWPAENTQAETLPIVMDADDPGFLPPPPVQATPAWMRPALAAAAVAVLAVLLAALRGGLDPVQPAAVQAEGSAGAVAMPHPAALREASATNGAPAPEMVSAAGGETAGGQPAPDPAADGMDTQRLAELRRRLRADPDDSLAQAEMRRYVLEYDQRLRRAIRRGDLAMAERYLQELQQMAPDNLKVRQALRRVQDARASRQVQARTGEEGR